MFTASWTRRTPGSCFNCPPAAEDAHRWGPAVTLAEGWAQGCLAHPPQGVGGSDGGYAATGWSYGNVEHAVGAAYQCAYTGQWGCHPDGPDRGPPHCHSQRVGWLHQQRPDGYRRGPSCHCGKLGKGHEAVAGPRAGYDGHAVAPLPARGVLTTCLRNWSAARKSRLYNRTGGCAGRES